MKVNIYRLEKNENEKGSNITYQTFVEAINADLYEKQGKALNIKGNIFEFFMQEKERDKIYWIEELNKAFKITSDDYIAGNIYNGILLVRKADATKPVYAITLGHSFASVQKYCDYNFAMDFAEKEIPMDKVTSKASDFIQSNKIRALLNIKQESLVSSKGGESYKFVIGNPNKDVQDVYGKKLECGYSIHFPNNYEIKDVSDLEKISKLIQNIEHSLTKKSVNSFPRVTYVPRSDKTKINILNELLLKSIKENSKDFEVYASDFDIIGADIMLNTNTFSYQLYVNSLSKETKVVIESFDKDDLFRFIEGHKDKISNLDDIKVIISSSDYKLPATTISNYLFGIVEYDNDKYILSSGRWGLVNQTFLTEVERRLNEISAELMIQNRTDYFIPYKNEGDFIDSIYKLGGYETLDQKFVFVTEDFEKLKENKIELADSYNVEDDELIAIKLGNSNQDFIYCFDQMNTAAKAILYNEEYKIKKQLISCGIDLSVIERILKCRNTTVLLGFEQEKYKKTIIAGTFNLNDLESLLLKLKIISSIDYIIDNGMKFKLYVIPGVKKEN